MKLMQQIYFALSDSLQNLLKKEIDLVAEKNFKKPIVD
jgi:predicted nucleotidyltransferase